MQMQVAIPDAGLVQWANQNLKVSPGTTVQEAKLGGTRREVRANTLGGHFHHMPNAKAMEDTVSYEERYGIWMYEGHHDQTDSNGIKGDNGKNYRRDQKRLIDAGRYDKALYNDVQNVKQIAPGLYDLSILQMHKNMRRRGVNNGQK
jgi:hypothetical protein